MINMNFECILFYFTLYSFVYSIKLDEIFTCVNETECDELTEGDVGMKEDITSTTTENTYNSTGTNIDTLIYPTETTKLQTASIPPTNYKIMYNNSVKNHGIRKMYSNICECDLTVSSCDINCCCDKDCNDFHLTVFSHCENYQSDLFDKRYCYRTNFIERNNTPFILEKLANNLFCILYDNLPPNYGVNDKLDINSEKDVRQAINSSRLTWKWQDQLQVPEFNVSSLYRDDDMIWIIRNNYIQSFEILQSGFTDLCSFKKTVKYLRQWKHECLQTDLHATNKFLFPAAFNNFSVILSPYLLNETYIGGLDEVCPKNVCLMPTSYYCNQTSEECSNVTIPGSCINATCYNIVEGVKYVILHNGSSGINNINVYFKMSNVSKSFYQQFEVIYEWADLNKEKTFQLSGNPGYIIGKPLLIGNLKVNKTNELQIKSVNFNKTNGFLTLPVATRNGECNKIDRYILDFGEDVKIKCSISVNTNNFSTESCVELQNLTMYSLFKDSLFNVTQVDQYNVYVSKSGNFSNNDTAEWVQILLDRIPENDITGELTNGRLKCSGLITSIHINVLYHVLAKPETLTNYNILGVGLTFSNESNISWSKCLPEKCTDRLKVDVVSYVTFHDVSMQSKYYFIGGRKINLSRDLFYPLLSSSSCLKMQSIFLIITMYSVSLHNFIRSL